MTRSYDDAVPKPDLTDPDTARFAEAARAEIESAYQLAFGLGEDLAARRHELQLTQAELAQRAGVPQADVSRIERGKGNPTIATLERLADVLGLQVRLQPRH